MPREYRHIKLYEKEIIELWEQGKSFREIAEMYGFTKEQVQEFKTIYDRKQMELNFICYIVCFCTVSINCGSLMPAFICRYISEAQP